jgi:Hemerythrin HHE cation binding domain
MSMSSVPRPAVEGLVNVEIPLVGLSHCHGRVVSQLQAFAELPAVAAQSRKAAANMLALFQFAVYGHHADEENELFPAVLRSAAKGEEAERLQSMVQRLTAEHREIESRWKKLEPLVKSGAEPSDLDPKAMQDLVQRYMAHALFEEQQFLPIAQAILSRTGPAGLECGRVDAPGSTR